MFIEVFELLPAVDVDGQLAIVNSMLMLLFNAISTTNYYL